MRVYLTGFSGSGKSTIGRLLAKRMNCRFVDVDSRVEKKVGMDIPALFRRKGERAFRMLEQEVLSNIQTSANRRLVVALGGGAMQNPVVRKMLVEDGVTVYLSCSARELYRRLSTKTNRPLLDVEPEPGETPALARRRRIRDLLKRRRVNYVRADLSVSTTSKTPAQAAGEVYLKIRRYHGWH